MYDERSSHSNFRTIATALAVWLSIFLTVRAFALPASSVVKPLGKPAIGVSITARK
jgi:hypothetical protein